MTIEHTPSDKAETNMFKGMFFETPGFIPVLHVIYFKFMFYLSELWFLCNTEGYLTLYIIITRMIQRN
jgi:hypothetical protein